MNLRDRKCRHIPHTSQWHGWMLLYLTKHCFNEGNRRQAKNDPFKKFARMLSGPTIWERITWKNNLQTLRKISRILNCKKLFGVIISIFFFTNLLKGFIKKTNAEFALFTLSIFSWF